MTHRIVDISWDQSHHSHVLIVMPRITELRWNYGITVRNYGDAELRDANAASDSGAATQAFTSEQERLIELNADLESQCRGNPPGEENGACAKREAAMDRLNAAGVCWGTEDQANAEFDFHICHPGSNGYESSPQARSSSVDAM